jgi:diguanylate cyclase (GGDEF)-like protein
MARDRSGAGAPPAFRQTRAQSLAVWGLIAALVTATLVLQTGFVGRLHAPAGPVRIPWWLLAAAFALVEVCGRNVQVRRHAATLSLTEIPLVLGLFFATPEALVAGRLAGSLLAFLGRRQAPVKVAFNTSLLAAETTLALAVFALLAGPEPTLGPVTWLATGVAMFLSGACSRLLVELVVHLHDGWAPVSRSLVVALRFGLLSLPVTVLGLVAACALEADALRGLLLAAAVVTVLAAHQRYGLLADRHATTIRLFGFSQQISRTQTVDEVLDTVLAQAQDLLRADRALVLLTGSDSSPARVRRAQAGAQTDEPLLRLTQHDPVLADVVASRGCRLAPRGTREPELRRFLDASGLREAVVAPLVSEGGLSGVLVVADRAGALRSFDASDVLVLELVAAQAGLALGNTQLIDRLRHEALHDALTGLPNRALLTRRLSEAAAAAAAGEAGAAVLLLDLNGFKQVNDTLGHAYGDQLLRTSASRLVEAAGPHALVARLGGDEFAVLAPGLDREAATALAARVEAALREPVTIEGTVVEVGGSVGVALAPEHGADPSGLLRAADAAMYVAKRSSRGVQLYTPGLAVGDGDPIALSLAAELRHALDVDDQIVVEFQPQADLRTGEVRSVEALVRWHHPTRGRVAPDAFLPVAERSGLMRALTSRVLELSVAACVTWRRQGLDAGVAVNLSARGLADLQLDEQVADLLTRHQLPAHLLTLELTETMIMTEPAEVQAALRRLHAMGVRLSVDDFGTGYSSLSYLSRLPVRELKIDRSFVREMARSESDAAIVRTVIDLAASLRLDVVAEGVEDEAVREDLLALGCDLAQGYHIARPMPAVDLVSWERSRRTMDAAA